MSDRDSMRWVRRGGVLAVLAFGWAFIAWQNHFHITAPVVFVCLGFLAVVATVYNLWRTGSAVVTDDADGGDSTWAKPTGALGELAREKRTLLKAIKEAEFDHQMGKLSQLDVDEMIRGYRARAIEVIKEIERLDSGTVGTTREQILRTVRAQIEVDAKSKKAEKPAKPVNPVKPADPDEVKSDQEALDAKAEAVAARERFDEAMNADSTTTVEPTREEAVKEATP
jgi:hypothetical protein